MFVRKLVPVVLAPVLAAALLLGAFVGFQQIARGQSTGGETVPGAPGRESQGENIREVTLPEGGNAPAEPAISFIDSPSAVCYQPDKTEDVCFLNWYYLSVSASPNYMITMTLTLSEFGPIAHVQGFFQTSMYVPYEMFQDGFKVACGAAGSGGKPDLGRAYGYTVRARDSAGLSSANYGTAYCPPFTP